MMISPSMFVDRLQKADYLHLISERDRLMAFIKEYESKEIVGDRSGEEWLIDPQPDVRYQVYLEYLSELCVLMKEKYNSEYVWGDKKLSDDAKEL